MSSQKISFWLNCFQRLSESIYKTVVLENLGVIKFVTSFCTKTLPAKKLTEKPPGMQCNKHFCYITKHLDLDLASQCEKLLPIGGTIQVKHF